MSENTRGGVASAEATGDESDALLSSLWQINISPAPNRTDRLAQQLRADCSDAGLPDLEIRACRGYLLQGVLTEEDVRQLCVRLFADPVVEQFTLGSPGAESLNHIEPELAELFHVLPKAGVTDPEAETAHRAICELGYDVAAVRTFRQFRTSGLEDGQRRSLGALLANESVEQLVVGPILMSKIELGTETPFELQTVSLRDADESQLESISKQWALSLTLVEMRTIQEHYGGLKRDPTDIELESIAQTWSEHCSHKTLAGRVEYTDENGTRQFENMLKETIFAATQEIRRQLGENDWCVSVFQDNAGIVRFDEQNNVAFKVETHNRPSALEPYGGANTGIGGVIRDTLGTGMGAKPICNTDVFCFAPPDAEDLPPGVLPPRRVMKGVVAGVRDYGNRMGIPTVNGAVYFDPRYIGNPLVFCGNVGILPHEHSFKQPKPNDLIVAIGGRTGRDGIHGATFSSAELTEASEVTSGGAVQIGNAITEKMLMDVLLQARDAGLYNAVTDCGAGGFSSAVGEMGEEIGAEVWLDKAPLKYEGLSYTEIWISEAQERMVFAVPVDRLDEFVQVCQKESVEATVIGEFCPTGKLTLKYDGTTVGELSMSFLHDGRPPVIRKATYQNDVTQIQEQPVPQKQVADWTADLCSILGSLNVASKHWVIRQYDHEVQGGSVVKPLVGVQSDGPSDAAVVRPLLNSRRGVAVSCGMNPHLGELDPYHMAASSIDEAIRNCVAVGADPDRIAILDNFCWGYTDRAETLGSLVRAAIACHDLSIKFKTPFISGKDSLNNEFSYTAEDGKRETISIPPTLLISAIGQVDDVEYCTTMDLKEAGNAIYLLGQTNAEMGGSHWNWIHDRSGGQVPTVDADKNRALYLRLHRAIAAGLVRACHDLSEGGLAVSIAEMAFAGGLGAELDLRNGQGIHDLSDCELLFSESNGRLLCEVPVHQQDRFEEMLGESARRLGSVLSTPELLLHNGERQLVRADLDVLKSAWQSPLDWE